MSSKPLSVDGWHLPPKLSHRYAAHWYDEVNVFHHCLAEGVFLA